MAGVSGLVWEWPIWSPDGYRGTFMILEVICDREDGRDAAVMSTEFTKVKLSIPVAERPRKTARGQAISTAGPGAGCTYLPTPRPEGTREQTIRIFF